MPTYLLIALNVAMYAYTSVISGDFMQTGLNVILVYGQVNSFVLRGWYWQLFTSMFIHVSILHLLGNMLFLLMFGLRAEGLFSVEEYLIIYFLSGLAGNLLTLLFGLSMISAVLLGQFLDCSERVLFTCDVQLGGQ